MIIKNFLLKIKISNYTLILYLLCFITGLYKEVLGLSILIFFHELGHYFVSYLFKWNIRNITFYPFGGLIKYDEIIDKPFIEEFLITLGGPVNQMIIFFIMFILYKNNIISLYFFNIIKNYNYSILIFNILPIIPLDGFKIFNIIINKLFCFRKSYYLSGLISLIILIFYILHNINNYSYLLIYSFLIYEIINYIYNNRIIFNRFILEKSLYKNKYKSIIKISNINKLKRNKRHLFYINNTYYSEKEGIKKIKGV